MINDILFCLVGYTGGVFIDTGNSFKVSETSPITESEKEALKKIAEIGFRYKILKDFVTNYEELFNSKLISNSSLFSNADSSYEGKRVDTSVYLTPICQSLSAYLRQYEKKIFELENNYYKNLVLTVTEIISTLDHYALVFDKIYEFLHKVTEKNLKGGNLVNFLYEATITGDREVKEVFKSFFIYANKLALSFVTFWIINGEITTDEFFITSANNFIVKEEGIKNYSNFITDSSKNELESWSANYYIEYSNIPVYFPHSLVEDILFVGKAIKILNSNKNSDEDKIPFNEISIFYTTLQKLNDVCFNCDSDSVSVINIELITNIVNLIKSCSAKYLWKLVVNKKGFFDHLTAVKNMYLTFNGEFFFNFINKIKNLLNMPFDKRIEKEINEIYFRNAMKEVFNIDTEPQKEKIYGNFKIKLISSGFNYTFQNENIKSYIDKKEISFLGSINFDSYSNSLRFINTSYKTLPGALWNLISYDVDEEFTMLSSFKIKNFTKPKGISEFNSVNASPMFGGLSPRVTNANKISENEFLKSSLIKGRKSEIRDLKDFREEENFQNEKRLVLNYIMHSSKNFEYKNSQPLNLNDLFNYFNFQFTITYDLCSSISGSKTTGFNFFNNPNRQSYGQSNLNSNVTTSYKVKSLKFSLRYVNKIKKLTINNETFNVPNLQNTQNIDSQQVVNNSQNNFNTLVQINENEIEIYTKTIFENLDFLQNDSLAQIQFSFKDNFCTVFNDTNSLNFSFPFTINQFIPKDKRKMTIGLIINSENLDIILDINSWHFNFYSGEIYNENSNLILINYNPPWPHNFLFNENILKMYNLIFNLIFPLKTNLILLDQLWIEKKNIAKKENAIFRLIDSLHSEFVCFLQSLISFYLFDLVDLKFKQFYAKIKDCQDFEQIIISHEDFLGEVISNSFVKSKKIMRVIFDILYTTRKFHNYVENLLINFQNYKIEEGHLSVNSSMSNEIYNRGDFEQIKTNLMGIKEEFNSKVKNLIFILSKIKNTKYFTIISQLLIKLDFQFLKNDY